MQYSKSKNKIAIRLDKDFNMVAAQQVETLAGSKVQIHLDLSQSRLVDSEAVALIHRYLLARRRVVIKNPPKIFYEVIRILGLHTQWQLDELIDPESNRVNG